MVNVNYVCYSLEYGKFVIRYYNWRHLVFIFYRAPKHGPGGFSGAHTKYPPQFLEKDPIPKRTLGALLVVKRDRLLAIIGVGFATQTDASFVSALMEEGKGSQRHPST